MGWEAAAVAGGAVAQYQASAAMGVVITVEADDFLQIVSKTDNPLVVVAAERKLGKGIQYKYLMSYRGLVFYTVTDDPLRLPASTEFVQTAKIRVPQLF